MLVCLAFVSKVNQGYLYSKCNDQKLVRCEILTRVQASTFFLKFPQQSTASVTSDPPKSIYSSQKQFRSNQSQPPKPHHPELFLSESHVPKERHHSLKSPAVQYPRLHSKALSNNHRDLCLQSHSLFSPTLKTCNIHALKIDSYEISCIQSQPSHQQSRPLQQIHTWRSCSYANLTIASSASRPTVQYK